MFRPRPLLFVAMTAAFMTALRRPPHHPPDIVRQARVIATTDRRKAVEMLEGYLAHDPDPAAVPWAELWAGEERRLLGDLPEARAWFAKLAKDQPDGPLHGPAVLGMALVDARQSLSGNTLATLQLIGDDQVPATMNADRYRLLARLAADEGSQPAEVKELVDKAVAYAVGDPEVESRVHATLADLLSDEQAESLAPPAPDAADGEELALRHIRAALHDKRFEEVVKLGIHFDQTWPDSAHKGEVEGLVERAKAGDPTSSGKICVLLPLSGDFAPVGAQLREDIEGANEASGSPMNLVFHDTMGGVDAAVNAVKDSVLKEGCVGILGPLLKSAVPAAASAAVNLDVPLVSLSQSADPTSAGRYAFQGFLPLDQQVRVLVDHAMGVRGWKRFAILYPNNDYGRSARDLFANEVEKRGGAVLHTVGYDPSAGDFRKAAQTLGQKDYRARAGEYWRLKRSAERAGQDPSKVVLPPIIDYDAIFLPDDYRRVTLVASALAVEEFPVGAFRPYRHAPSLPLLGLNGWNNPKLVEAGGLYVRDCIFVDAFFPESGDPLVDGFVKSYQSRFGRSPLVVDAVTWDVARLMAAAVQNGGDTREHLREALTQVRLDDAVAGGVRFGPNRHVQWRIHVLTITKNGIEAWKPPETPADGAP